MTEAPRHRRRHHRRARRWEAFCARVERLRDPATRAAHYAIDRLQERSTVRALISGAAGLVGVAVDPVRADLWAGATAVVSTLIAVSTQEKPPC